MIVLETVSGLSPVTLPWYHTEFQSHPSRAEEGPSGVCHGESLASPLVAYLLNFWPYGHVRGWLEGGLVAQGVWVGKLGACVGRLVGLGVWGLMG